MTGTLGSWLGPFFAALRLVGERRGQRPLSGLHRAGPLRVLGGSTVISTASRALGGPHAKSGRAWPRATLGQTGRAGGSGGWRPRVPPSPPAGPHARVPPRPLTSPLPPVLTPDLAPPRPAGLLTGDQALSSPTSSLGGPGRAQGPGPPSRAASLLPSLGPGSCWRGTRPGSRSRSRRAWAGRRLSRPLPRASRGRLCRVPLISCPLSCRVL